MVTSHGGDSAGVPVAAAARAQPAARVLGPGRATAAQPARRRDGPARARRDRHGRSTGTSPCRRALRTSSRCWTSLGWARAVVVGHSWGASVALETAASAHDRVAAAVLVDGGTVVAGSAGAARGGPRGSDPAGSRHPGGRALGPDPRGRPRALVVRRGPGSPRPDLPCRRPGAGPNAARDGSAHEGPRRHARPRPGLGPGQVHGRRCSRVGGGLRAGRGDRRANGQLRPGSARRTRRVADARLRGNCLVQRWSGAVHDVPLQWPALVAGLVDTVVEQAEGGDR